MIYYRPTDGDPETGPLLVRPRTCFLMTQLAKPLPDSLPEIHRAIQASCVTRRYSVLDAESLVTGKDFLLNIWKLALSVPVGIAVIHEEMETSTVANIFYEVGLMQALGKETLVVKTADASVPSDFVRTEYVEYDADFGDRFGSYLDSLDERAKYFAKLAQQLEKDPLLSIDSLRRAFLITGSKEYRDQIEVIRDAAGFEGRARNSVELLATQLHVADA